MGFQQGNVFGRMGAPVTNALRRAALADDARGLRRAAERVIDSAANGDTWQERMAAFAFLADRIEGKAIARIESTSTDARGLDLQTVVQAVLAARASGATDAQLVNEGRSDSENRVDSENHSHPALPDSSPIPETPTSPEGATP